jgi:hypothetical protein
MRANRRAFFLQSADVMSKPRWAPRHRKWGPVKPGFWNIWHPNKESLKRNGYSVRRNDNGEWEVRYVPVGKAELPSKPDAIFVPTGTKASLCLKCGHVKLINRFDEHKDCTLCGEKIGPTNHVH